MWAEGIEKTPDGSRVRQVPQKYAWSTSTWCSEDGLVWKKHYNFVTARWRWEDHPLTPSECPNGELGIYLDGLLPLRRAIALAWKPRPRASTGRLEVEAGTPLVAKHLHWDGIELGDEPAAALPQAESWSALRWRCGIVPVPKGYQISTAGRLKAPSRHISSGFLFDSRMWQAVRGVGLVDLTTASRQRDDIRHLPPREYTAAMALMAGKTPVDLASALGVEVGSAWSYMTEAARKGIRPPDLLELGPTLVSRDLWRALVVLQGNARLGGGLGELMAAAEKLLLPTGEFRRSRFQMEQLKFARVCLASQ